MMILAFLSLAVVADIKEQQHTPLWFAYNAVFIVRLVMKDYKMSDRLL